jgi:hypothetical protein
MTSPTPSLPETSPTSSHAQATSAADQRIAALRSQLAMMQAERSLLHTRSATPSSPPPARSQHGPGGWIFAGFSFVFFISMIVFAATRPPTVRFVEVEVTREVLVPQTVEPVAVAAPRFRRTPEPETTRPRGTRNPRGTVGTTGTTMTTPMIELDRCGNDPLCGS